MAHVARLSDVVKGGVVGESLKEGAPVKMTTSGIHNDLPVLMKADQNAVKNVYCLMAVPDQFERPTDGDLYKAPWYTKLPRETGYSEPVETGKTYYKVGKSLLRNPTLTSGELGQAHRGGTYAVPSGVFVDSANIRVPGNFIKVGATNLWEYTATESEACGQVDWYDPADGYLYFTLYQ